MPMMGIISKRIDVVFGKEDFVWKSKVHLTT